MATQGKTNPGCFLFRWTPETHEHSLPGSSVKDSKSSLSRTPLSLLYSTSDERIAEDKEDEVVPSVRAKEH